MLIGAGNAGGGMDAANLLKPALARGELRTIAATTWSEYKQYFETDAALTRRFQVVKVNEPDDPTCVGMLQSLRDSMEQHHRVIVLDDALETAVSLSRKMIADRFLPDKAISLIDTACSRVTMARQSTPKAIAVARNQLDQLTQSQRNSSARQALSPQDKKANKQKVTQLQREIKQLEKQWERDKQRIAELDAKLDSIAESDKATRPQLRQLRQEYHKYSHGDCTIPFCVNSQTIKTVISDWTGIPHTRMDDDLKEKVHHLQHALQTRIVGQTKAQGCLMQNIKQSLLEINDPNKPMGVYLFTGPSGVGKTYTAQVVAEEVFGSREHMTLINLSEFKEAHKVRNKK